MKDKNIKIGIDEIKKITMTDAEKKHIYDSVLKYGENTKPVKSPWFSYSFLFMFQGRKLAYLIIIPLIFIISGGGIVFASTDILPDSVLYPIKVNVVEPIGGALIFSAKAKAKYESSLAEKRLVEAETLVNEGKLDITKEEKINRLLTKHTEALNSILDSSKSNLNGETDSIVTDFRAQMNAHARVLDSLKDNRESNRKENVSRVEEENRGDSDISNTARLGAEKIKNISDKKDGNKINKLKERKDQVKNIVDNTDIDINSSLTKESEQEGSVSDDTHKKIDQAKAYLYEADMQDKEGNFEEAYSSLLDSESSAKEAKILLKEGQKINKNKENRYRDNFDKQNIDSNY